MEMEKFVKNKRNDKNNKVLKLKRLYVFLDRVLALSGGIWLLS